MEDEAVLLPKNHGFTGESKRLKDLYVGLLKRTLLGLTYEDASNLFPVAMGAKPQRVPHDAAARLQGADWPVLAPTMSRLPGSST